MKRKVMVTAAMVALAAMLVSACTKEEPPQFTGEETHEPEYQAHLDAISPSAYNNVQGLDLEPGTYISIIGKEESSAYSRELRRGVEQAAEDLNTLLGFTGNDKIKVVYNGAAKGEDIGEQVNILDEELSRYPDVLGIASVDEDACTVQLDLATSNGIPIIAFDSGNTHPGILCTVKTDNMDAARTGAYKLANEIGGEGQVILLVNDSESESARERTESFLQEMKENQPDIEVVETIYLDKMEEYKKEIVEEKARELSDDEAEGENEAGEEAKDQDPNSKARETNGDVEGEAEPGETQEPSVKLTEEEKTAMVNAMSDEDVLLYYLEKYPDLKGVFGTSFSATQAGLKALRHAERDVVLMGFDAGKEQLEALESGEIKGLVVQNPFGIGYAAVVAAARTVLEIGNEAQVDTGYVWVTQENMEETSIKQMLYE